VAELTAVIASTHHPFYYKASTAPPEAAPPFAAEWVRKVEAFRETLTRAEPDVLLMVGSDHFHQLWLDNMPQFLVGNAEQYDANWEQAAGRSRAFPPPRCAASHSMSVATPTTPCRRSSVPRPCRGSSRSPGRVAAT
jgi:protocatechuate 4,5-dioxygenase beta chain